MCVVRLVSLLLLQTRPIIISLGSKRLIDTLKATVPAFADGAVFSVVTDNDAYMLAGNYQAASAVMKRVEVPCQHVLCLTEADKEELNVDGFKSHDVLAIDLRDAHSDLCKDFCYPPETKSYIGAAVRSSGVTIGSLCMASEKTIEELGWDDQQSQYLRQVVSVLEQQITELCSDWRTMHGRPVSLASPQPQEAHN